MFKLIFDSKAIDTLDKLPKLIKSRIFKKLQETKINPFRYFVKLEGRNEFKLRVGDYRVISELTKIRLAY